MATVREVVAAKLDGQGVDHDTDDYGRAPHSDIQPSQGLIWLDYKPPAPEALLPVHLVLVIAGVTQQVVQLSGAGQQDWTSIFFIVRIHLPSRTTP